MEKEIIHIALENLKMVCGIEGEWIDEPTKEINGYVRFTYDGQPAKFDVVIKKEFRNHQMDGLIKLAQDNFPLMLCTSRIFPKLKEELRQNSVAYLEANGNIFFKLTGQTVWIDTQKAFTPEKDTKNRAFTKTGLMVVFQLLLDESLVYKNYREIAEQTLTSLGNINNVFKGLRIAGYIVDKDNKTKILIKRRELFEKWITDFRDYLKPKIFLGTYRFIRNDDFINWKNIELTPGKAYWGGEPAGDLLTGHLRPGELTIYTNEAYNEIIKNYMLVPDGSGEVKVYQKFWTGEGLIDKTVPSMLVYADLMNTNDKRCIETAQKIYDEYIEGKL